MASKTAAKILLHEACNLHFKYIFISFRFAHWADPSEERDPAEATKKGGNFYEN
jgi:hypothetical protein